MNIRQAVPPPEPQRAGGATRAGRVIVGVVLVAIILIVAITCVGCLTSSPTP